MTSLPAAAAEPPKPAARQDSEEAGRHFKRGVDLFRDSDFGGALAEFRRAQQLAPNYRVLFNVGQTLFELQKYADALRAFEGYLEAGGKEISKERRAEVEADLEKLRARVATLEVTSNVEGAEVTVDGEVLGKAPLHEPLLLSAGRRTVTVSASEHVPVTRVVELAGGDHGKLAIELAPVHEAPAPAPAPVAAPAPVVVADPAAPRDTATPESSAPTTAMWAGWATTGVLVAATALSGGLTLKAKSDYDAALARTPGNPAEIDDARSHGRTLANVTTGLTIASVVAAGISTYFTVRVIQAGSAPEKEQGASLRVNAGPMGVFATGTF